MAYLGRLLLLTAKSLINSFESPFFISVQLSPWFRSASKVKMSLNCWCALLASDWWHFWECNPNFTTMIFPPNLRKTKQDQQRWRYHRTLVDLITSEGFCEGGGDSNTDEFSEKFQRGGEDSEVSSSKCVLFWFFTIQLLKKTYPEPWNYSFE